MKPEIKEKWINALRSGEYDQTKHSLQDEHGYCCLGVLCDIYSQEMNVPWEGGNEETWAYFFLDEPEHLPKEVVEWAGLPNTSPSVKDDNDVKVSLTELNDTGRDFKTISRYIEKSL